MEYPSSPMRDISSLFRKAGSELIFFIHGLGCVKESFADAWTSHFLDRYSLMAVDLPGFGDTPSPVEFMHSLENHAALCREVLKRVDYSRLHLVGHSMGGAIALLLAELIPNGPDSLISVEGNLIGSDCTISRRAVSVSYENFRTRLMRQMLLSARTSEEHGTRLWAEWSAKSSPIAFTESSRSLVEWSDSGELLQRFLSLTCRKAFFYGERNNMMPVLKMISDIPAMMIRDSGHFAMNDNPSGFYESLAAFLGG